MKKTIIFSLIFVLTFSLVPGISFGQTDNEMLHFVATVKWGNVQGPVEDDSETNFDGSITVSSNAKVSLIRTLLFEEHNNNADKITSENDPVSWNSLIYNHWDAVRVLISSPAGDSVTVNTNQGSITKTARELYNIYETGTPIVQDVGNGKEIWIKTHPVKNRQFMLGILWGATERTNYVNNLVKTIRCRIKGEGTETCVSSKKDFSGYFKIDSGGTLKFIRTIRFESKQGDEITNKTSSRIDWNSYIYGGVEGILVKLNLDKNLDDDDTVTIAFTSDDVDWQKSFKITELYHNRVTKESIIEGYGLIMKAWRRPNRTLVRVRNTAGVYMIEDDMKRPIPSPEVFNSNGFDWSDIEEIDEEELNDYAEGDVLGYPDGTLIQGSGPAVYVVSEGEKRPFVSPRAFNGLGYKWGLIKKVSDGHLNLYEEGDAITENSSHPNGALIRVIGTPGVYRIEGGERKPIATPAIFNANKWGWNYILEVQAQHMNRFQLGEVVGYPDGSLLSAPDGKVYKIDKGERRWIRSADDFNNAGFNWAKITPVTNVDVNVFEEGEDIVGDDFETSE